MTRARLLVIACALGCGTPGKPATRPPDLLGSGLERDLRSDLVVELQSDILQSYERDDAPEVDTAMVDPLVGQARIGVGPADVWLGGALATIRTRWPLIPGPRTPAVARSKRLETHVAADHSAAWVSDEISWRIQLCGRTAVIPLRMTGLYARDGDRWVQVFEHLSFGSTPMPLRPGARAGTAIPTAVAGTDLEETLAAALEPMMARAVDKAPPTMISRDPAAFALGAATDAEWHAAELDRARLVPGTEPMKLGERRVGIVGRTLETATVAYWVGTVSAALPARPGIPAGVGQFRATFVFAKRGESWQLVQTHVSAPIEDSELASSVFGTALLAVEPLAINCG